MSISRPEPDWSTLEIPLYNSIFFDHFDFRPLQSIFSNYLPDLKYQFDNYKFSFEWNSAQLNTSRQIPTSAKGVMERITKFRAKKEQIYYKNLP